jgi:hypothetical protein
LILKCVRVTSTHGYPKYRRGSRELVLWFRLLPECRPGGLSRCGGGVLEQGSPRYDRHLSNVAFIGFWWLRLSGRNAKFIGHPHKIDHRPCSHLSHDLAAMDFHRHLAQVEFVRNLLVLAAGGNKRKDLSFARR